MQKNRGQSIPRCAPIFIFLSLGGLFVRTPNAAAEPPNPRTVAHFFESDRADAELEDLLYLTLGVAFANAGYSSTRKTDAELALKTSYSVHESEATITMSLRDAGDSDGKIASLEMRVRIGFDMDAEIETAVARLLSDLAVPPPDAETPAEIAELFSSPLISERDTLRTGKTRRIEALGGGGATFFIGEFSDYAGVGVDCGFQTGFLYIRRRWSLSASPRFSVTRAIMSDGVDGGALYLTTAGLNAQYGIGADQRYRFAACASGGAAIISLLDGDLFLNKTLPYADAGVQAGFPVGRDFFFGGDIRFRAIFDPELLIAGISASAALCKEF